MSTFHVESIRKGRARASDMGSSTCVRIFYDWLYIHNTNSKEGTAFGERERVAGKSHAYLCS